MRKAQKKQAEDFIKLLSQAHDEISRLIEKKPVPPLALDLLGQCQEGAVELGNFIEKIEGEQAPVIALLEDYCEQVYQIYEKLTQGQEINPNKINKKLRKALIQVENNVKNDIKTRYEIAFFPYKASMWDSMESVWQAADRDPDCDPYVVPIPYYDRQPNGMLGTCHYEGDKLPSYVSITHYNSYRLRDRQPDIIYIHNPYDYANYVTTVAPEYYSSELKKYTECLVYIPYYSTTGGMSDGQASCPAYYNADYIIIQAEKYRKFFDPYLPKEKLVPLGSPKFDRTLRLCADPPQPPESWRQKMEGKTVYFYNTSLNGMLGDTERFLKKMEYVFRCFEGREDACLLWRPHPLMESTFLSMRRGYKPRYDALRDEFIRKDMGIYDDTPDITNTIALSDAYIGDSGTSVTSLFGMAGKPQFILDNSINSAPGEEDWRGAIVRGFPVVNGIRGGKFCVERDSWIMTQGNKLYRSLGEHGTFRYVCDLSDYAYGGYYTGPVLLDQKAYMCPINAQDILVVSKEGIEKRIKLEPLAEQSGIFYAALVVEKYLFLIPNQYPAIVRYDTENDQVSYFDINKDFFIGIADGERRCGGVGVKGRTLYLASPVDNHVLAINGDTGEWDYLTLETESPGGYLGMPSLPYDSDFWLLPYSGNVVTRWNPETGEAREYTVSPEGFQCYHITYKQECEERPFGSAVFYKNYVYLSPCWGNQYVRLDKDTGEVQEWNPPIEQLEQPKNGYFPVWAKGYLDCLIEGTQIRGYRLFSMYDRKLYQVDFENNECREIKLDFDVKELRDQEPGFKEQSQWMQYGCQENAFNSLTDFLDGRITGGSFDRERQLQAYRQLAANSDGTSGEKIHQFVKEKL